MPARSLKYRLGVRLAIGLLALWIVASLATAVHIRHEMHEAFDAAMSNLGLHLLAINSGSTALAVHVDDSDLDYLVRDGTGRVLASTDVTLNELLPTQPGAGRGFVSAHGYRVYSAFSSDGSRQVQVAALLSERNHEFIESILALLMPLLLLAPASLAVVWWFVRRELRPLDVVGAQLSARGAGDLAPIDAPGLPCEILPLTDAVNRLMVRLARALETERQFTADTAHELRTPLARALAQAQRLKAEAHAGPLRQRAVEVEFALHQLTRHAEKLLQLARADGGRLLADDPGDVLPALNHVLEDFMRSPEQAGRVLLTACENATLMSSIDLDAFAILMRNLIENALRHSPAGSTVQVHVEPDGVVRVVNEGPIVPTDQLGRLSRRFERGTSSAAGSGLGLAIAQAIAQGSGARLVLASPAHGLNDGFEALLAVPGLWEQSTDIRAVAV